MPAGSGRLPEAEVGVQAPVAVSYTHLDVYKRQVGDGINDSPALSCADVSVSMKDSSDIAREVADISLLSSSLSAVSYTHLDVYKRQA